MIMGERVVDQHILIPTNYSNGLMVDSWLGELVNPKNLHDIRVDVSLVCIDATTKG